MACFYFTYFKTKQPSLKLRVRLENIIGFDGSVGGETLVAWILRRIMPREVQG
jgi:hypothetical protein